MYEVAKDNVHKIVDTEVKMAAYEAKGFTAVGVVDPSADERAAAAAQVITDEAYVTLLDDFHAAAAVIVAIGNLPKTINPSTPATVSAVNAAEVLYEALTAQAKTFVINYSVLEAALAIITPSDSGDGGGDGGGGT